MMAFLIFLPVMVGNMTRSVFGRCSTKQLLDCDNNFMCSTPIAINIFRDRKGFTHPVAGGCQSFGIGRDKHVPTPVRQLTPARVGHDHCTTLVCVIRFFRRPPESLTTKAAPPANESKST